MALADFHPERGLLRWLLRWPRWLYRAKLGWLLDKRFLLLTHTGRKTGRPHQTVLEIVNYAPATGVFVVASGWGEKANWFRNLQAQPAVTITVGTQSRPALAVRLSETEATHALFAYAWQHPFAFRQMTRLITGQKISGLAENVRALARAIPLIALRPVSPSPQD
jgi:deazaflavin-dependent oxidoreductase (nitroreductase family)